MALQYKNDPKIEDDTHGYSAGVSSGAVNDWADVALNGSHTTVLYWDDTSAVGTCAHSESRVYMTVTDTWRATINPDTNAITVHVDSSFDMNRQMLRWGGSGCGTAFCWRDVHVYTSRGGSEIKYCADCLYNSGVFCNGSRSFDITLQHGQEMSVGSFFVRNDSRNYEHIYYDLVSGGMRFRNTLPAPKYTPSASTSCSAYSSGNVIGGKAKISNIDYGCPSGNDCSANLTTVTLYSDSGYTNVISTSTTKAGSGTFEYKGLTPNHKYYVKYTITNGKYTKNYTCSFTTMASSYPYGYKFLTDQVSWIYLQINNGDDECDITTKLYLREKGTQTWELIDTTTSETGLRETLRNKIVRGKTYEAYSTTQNCAGTYTSTTYEFAPPAADSIVGVITSHSSTLQPSGMLADIDYCYKVTSYAQEPVSESNPIISHIEYSLDKVVWTPTDNVTSTTNPVTICDTLVGLQCSSTYYLRTWQKVGDTTSYSAIVQVTTPTCADFNNCVCDNLSYMTELICQQLFRIKTGQKTIYTNCDTKEVCDPYSNNPTLASILSRLLRFAEAAACLICSMEALDIFKSGETDQVFTAATPGESGQWITLDYYPVEGSENLVASCGVAEAIQDYIESVFHPIGKYDYWAEDMAELEEQTTCESGEPESGESGESGVICEPPAEGDTAVVGEYYYTYTNGVWVQTGEVTDLGDFAVITIEKGTYFDKNFFWWNDEWYMINIDGAGELEERVGVMEQFVEENQIVHSYDLTENYKIAVVPDNYTDAQIQAAITPDPAYEIVIFTTITTLPSTDIVVNNGV